MDGIVGPFCRQDPIFPANFLRDDLPGRIADLQCLPHGFQHRSIGKSGGQGVNGQDAAGGDRGRIQRLEDRGGHIIADEIAGYGAVENVLLAVLELLGGEFLVEEGQRQPAGVVGHGDFC